MKTCTIKTKYNKFYDKFNNENNNTRKIKYFNNTIITQNKRKT